MMEDQPIQRPDTVKVSNIAETDPHHRGPEIEQNRIKDAGPVAAPEYEGCDDQDSASQVDDTKPDEDPLMRGAEEAQCLEHDNAGEERELTGGEEASHGYVDDPRELTGETTYHWLRDITTRVTSIENRIEEEDNRSTTESTASSDASDSEPDDDDSYMFRTKPEIKVCRWETFKNRVSTDDNANPAIEMLLQSTDLDVEIEEEQLRRQSQESGAPPASQRLPKPSSTTQSTFPADKYERIRINSAFIIAFLGKVADQDFWTAPPLKPLTFLSPFKILIYFREQMEEELRWLEEKFGQSASTHPQPEQQSGNSPAVATAEASVEENNPFDEEPRETSTSRVGNAVQSIQAVSTESHLHPSGQPNKDETAPQTPLKRNEEKHESNRIVRDIMENGSYEAYIDMKCYVDFVRTKLVPRYEMFQGADYKQPLQVRYDELWSLFRLGELVYQRDAADQKDTDKSGESQLDSDNPRSDTTGPRLWRVFYISTSVPAWHVDDLSLNEQGRSWTAVKIAEVPKVTKVSVYYIDFDGTSYSGVPRDYTIPFFNGEKDITSLPIYPVRFAKDHEQVVKQLHDRGAKFQNVASRPHPLQSYEGWTLIRDPGGKPIEDAQGKMLRFPEHIDGDIIIDFHEALQIHPWWKPDTRKYIHYRTPVCEYRKDHFPINSWADKERSKLLGRTWEWAFGDTSTVASLEFNKFAATDDLIVIRPPPMYGRVSPKLDLSAEDLALLPTRIFVYALRERKFVNADIRFLRQSSVMQNPFKSLEIAEDHKSLIESTVFEHFEKKKVQRDAQRRGLEMSDQDFIRGKGRGLIILLHGAPGVGKTATAEACSYAYNKPLFPITCGDLGIEPKQVEETLSELFRLANLWDCILLFDEAEIFLSTREKKDDNLQRNALVSIFLRTLEYYSGILFLTTNRAGALDEAVKSRVHISLYYPYLGLNETKALFQMNIKRLRNIEAERARISEKPAMAIEEKRILKFAEEHYMRFEKEYDKRWNGRQIRNAFQIATSLARHEYHRHCEEGNSHRGLYLTSDHFQTVENATQKYDEYRQQMFQKTGVEIAAEREERYHP